MIARLFISLALLAAPMTSARADVIGSSTPGFNEIKPRRFESPQRFALEIKFTPYTPHIDQSAGLHPGQTPFADLYNSQLDDNGKSTKGQQPPYRVLTSIEFDVQFLRRAWGNLGVGITTGYYRRSTHGFELQFGENKYGASTVGPCTVPYCTRSGDETALNIIPLSALFIYRFDLLANRYHVPFVPYFKIGLAYYIWAVNNGGGGVSQKPESGYGGTFGFVMHPGLALQLDFIERGVAKTLDSEIGINHTYLFCELNYANINGFGASNKLNLSDTMLNAGMAFEF